MGVIAAAVKHMLSAGMGAEAIVAAVEAMEANAVPERTARQERNRRYYQKASEKRLNSDVSDVSDAFKTLSDAVQKKVPPDPLKEKQPPTTSLPPTLFPAQPNSGNGSHPVQSRSVGRGSRLSPAWRPNLDEEAFALAEGVSRDRLPTVAGRFRDHWIAKPGKDGVKLDWTATWRNWVRRDIDDYRKTGPPRASFRDPSEGF